MIIFYTLINFGEQKKRWGKLSEHGRIFPPTVRVSYETE